MSHPETRARGALCVALCVGLAIVQPVIAGGGPPLALSPLPTPFFSIDRASPTVDNVLIHADDILDKPGPTVQVSNVNLGLGGLGPPRDELDELSGFHHSVLPNSQFGLLFSVDRASVGAVPPDPGLVGIGRPFNVQQQAALHQAAGDLFMTAQLFNISGPVDPLTLALKNNTLVINQGDAGGVDFDLKPGLSPSTPIPPADPIDELDAVAMKEPAPFLGTDPGRIFFSVSRDSPSLGSPTLPGLPSGATVFIDNNTLAPGGQNTYAAPGNLGLQQADDIDGLIVLDNGDGVFQPGLDRVIFSLTPDSPTLGALGMGGADLFWSDGLGLNLYASAFQLGLLHTDNVDALDLLLTDDILASIVDHALFPEPATATLLLAGLALVRRSRR